MIKLKLIISYLLFSLIGLILLSCMQNMKEEKYDWTATLSAPEEYPIEVYKGEIIAEDFRQFLKGFGTIDKGWGENGPMVVVGPDLKKLPDSLVITWRSLIEKKNYTGKWALPTNKIAQFFKTGFINPDNNKKETYNSFVIGLAPKGNVVLWLSGSSKQLEIASFKAQETVINSSSVDEDDKYLFSQEYYDITLRNIEKGKPEIYQKITSNSLPKPEIYERIRTEFLWKPEILFENSSYSLKEETITTFSGELEVLFNEGLLSDKFEERKVPNEISFFVLLEDKSEKWYWVKMLDVNELLNAFNDFDKGAKIKFVIDLKSANKPLFYLSDGNMKKSINHISLKIK